MALTDRFNDYDFDSKSYRDDAIGGEAVDFRALATKISFLILRVLGAAVVGLIGGAAVGFLALVLATPFVDNSTLDSVFSVGTMVSWPVVALALWFTLFRSGQDL